MGKSDTITFDLEAINAAEQKARDYVPPAPYINPVSSHDYLVDVFWRDVSERQDAEECVDEFCETLALEADHWEENRMSPSRPDADFYGVAEWLRSKKASKS